MSKRPGWRAGWSDGQIRAMLRLLDELEVGFANNPKHHEAVIHRMREAIEKGLPWPTDSLTLALKRD